MGGISLAEKDVLSKLGVWIVKLLGRRRPVLGGGLSGELGADRACKPSEPEEVAGRGDVMLRDRFLTFRSLLVGDASRLLTCCGWHSMSRRSETGDE